MSDLNDVVKELGYLRAQMEGATTELEQIKRALDGWYDVKGDKQYDGISDSLLDASRTLGDIKSTLYHLGEENLAREVQSINSTVEIASNAANHGWRETRELISCEAGMLRLWFTLFATLTSAGIIAILGTLRNWF
jgi:hypothetical protein